MKEGEYALSKDVDVEVWLHYRAYNRHPPLCDVGDFIIVNSELHNNFDDFKRKELEPGYSYLQINELLQHYLKCMSQDGTYPTVKKYGEVYLHLHESMIDDLCELVEQLREKHSQVGNEVFITSKGQYNHN